MADRLGLRDAQARAALGYGGRFPWFRAGPDGRIIPMLEQALGSLPPGSDSLRIRLLARLAGALRDDPDMRRRDQLSAEAVELAQGGDEADLHFALISRFTAIMGPDSIDEMERLHRLAAAIYKSAHSFEQDGETIWHDQILTLTRGGSLDQFTDSMARYRLAAVELRQPSVLWYFGIMEGMHLIMTGRIAEADAQIDANAKLGRAATTWDAEYTRVIQRFAVRREQGRLAEIADEIERAIPIFAGYPHFRAVDAFIQASIGRIARARERVAELVDGASTIFGRDGGWLFAMGYLVEAALLVDDLPRAQTVGAALAPYAHLAGFASAEVLGDPVARHLALIAEREGRIDDAMTWLDTALAMATRSGARTQVLRMEVDRARMQAAARTERGRTAARATAAAASAAAAELGLRAIQAGAEAVLASLGTDPAAAEQEPSHAMEAAEFRRDGDVWVIAGFGDPPTRVRDSKGMRYLALLLASPGREYHALDLVATETKAPATADRTSSAAAKAAGLEIERSDPGLAALDDMARDAYRARMDELRAELASAETADDEQAAERATDELDALQRALAAAYGIGGRPREIGSASERARQAVSKSIKLAISHCAAVAPAVGLHLDRAVRTGTYCAYDPDPAGTPSWRL
jgi:hypothetical protein